MYKIVVIDDIYDHTITLKNFFDEAFPDTVVRNATTEREGLSICIEEKPDIILFGASSERINGVEVCKILRSNDLFRTTPLVMIIDSLCPIETRMSAFECGVDGFLSLPINKPDGMTLIKSMFRIKQGENLYRAKNGDSAILGELIQEVQVRRASDRALRLSEQNFKEIFNSISEAILIADPDTSKIMDLNNSMLNMFGYDHKEELEGFHLENLTCDEYDFCKADFQEYIRKSIDDGSQTFERRSKRKNGSYFWIEMSIKLVELSDQKRLLVVIRDISDRKFAEESVLLSEKRYKLLVESLDVGIGMSDLEGNVLNANQKIADLFGYLNEEEIQTQKCNFFDYLVPADRLRAWERFKSHIENNICENNEYVALRRDGSEFPVELKCSIIRDTNNLPLASVSVINDISYRKKIEETYNFLLNAGWNKGEEDFFSALARYLSESLNMSSVCINKISDDQIFIDPVAVYLNGKFLKPARQLLDQLPHREILADSPFFIARNAREHFSKFEFVQDIGAESCAGSTILDSAGKPIGLIVMFGQQAIKNQEMIQTVLNLVAIRTAGEMERLDAETALVQSKQAFQNYFENCSIGMSVTSPDKRWLEVNQALCDILGYSREELKLLSWLDITYPDDVAKNMVLLNQMISGEINRFELDKRFVRKDGTIIFVSLSAVGEYDVDGSLIHLLTSYVDISARLNAERSVKRERSLLRLLIDNLPNTIYVKDLQGCKIVTNKADLLFMNVHSESEVLGKSDLEIFGIEKGLEGYEEDMNVINSGLPLLNKEKMYVGSNGEIHWNLSSKIPFYNENNQIQGLVGIGVDITERKLMEEALKTSEAHYRNLIEKMRDGVYKSTPEGKFVTVNPAMVSLLGYQNIEELMAIDIKKELYFDEEERESLVLNDDVDAIEIFKLRKKDGSAIWVEDHGWYNCDENGNRLFHEGILRDVTERKRVEDRLRSLSLAVEQNPVSIIITNINGDIEYVNSKFVSVTGYSFDEVKGKNPRILKSEYISQEGYRELWNTILLGNVWRGEFKNRKKNGEVYFESATITAIKDEVGNISHFLGVKEDITEKKKDEILIRKLSKVIEQSPVSTIITDANGLIEFVNDAFTHLTYYTLDEVKGKHPRIFNCGHLPEVDFDHIWKVIKNGEIWRGEFENRRKDGLIYWENVTISPLMNKFGKITSYILLMNDISERKRMIDELIISKEHAEESNRLKSAFLATMNHELRTPLNHILGFSELILSGTSPADNPSFASNIQESGRNLLSIIEDVFDLAMVEQSNITVRKQTFSLMDHFMENKASLDSLIRKSSKLEMIQLVFKPDIEWLSNYITTDRSKVNQVLTNLFKNAVKFTKNGTIEFGYIMHDKKNTITYYVKDSGIGIPVEKQNIIFDLFRQGDDTVTRAYGGIGAGLSIAQKITKIIGGDLHVVSEYGHGSCFSLTIPIEITSENDYNNNA